VISWMVPSMSLELQETSNLTSTNWTQVGSVPTLNVTNLGGLSLKFKPRNASFDAPRSRLGQTPHLERKRVLSEFSWVPKPGGSLRPNFRPSRRSFKSDLPRQGVCLSA
jgi:hypothetical protein